jgi:hypothetical protein
MIRLGTVVDPDHDAIEPRLFGYVVDRDPVQQETLSEPDILHNPWADTPLSPGALRGITEHQRLEATEC